MARCACGSLKTMYDDREGMRIPTAAGAVAPSCAFRRHPNRRFQKNMVAMVSFLGMFVFLLTSNTFGNNHYSRQLQHPQHQFSIGSFVVALHVPYPHVHRYASHNRATTTTLFQSQPTKKSQEEEEKINLPIDQHQSSMGRKDQITEETTSMNNNNNNNVSAMMIKLAAVTSSILGGMTWTSFNMVSSAAAVEPPTTTTATASSTSPPPSLIEISPGAAVIESDWISSNPYRLIKSVVPYGTRLLSSVISNRQELIKVVQTVQTYLKTTVATEQSLQDIQVVLEEFLENELKQHVSIQFPNSPKQTLEDLRSGKLNVIVNGRIVNIQLEQIMIEPNDVVNGGTDDTANGDTTVLAGARPESEYVLRLKSFRGQDVQDAAAIALAGKTPDEMTYVEQFELYWNTPYDTKYLPDWAQDIGIKRGDIFGLNLFALLGLVYAASWAYYVEEQERQGVKRPVAAGAAAKTKTKTSTPAGESTVKKEPSTAKSKTPAKTKETTPPPPPSIDDASAERLWDRLSKDIIPPSSTTKTTDDEPVRVSVMVSKVKSTEADAPTTTTTASTRVPMAIVEALYVPWIGMIPGIERQKAMKVIESLYLPWLGMVYGGGGDSSDDEDGAIDPSTIGRGGGGSSSATDEEDASDLESDQNVSLLPLLRTLYFPWLEMIPTGK